MFKEENAKYKFWNKKKVLVTGHNGFKGSWLCLWLRLLGADVYGFSLPIKEDKSLFRELTLKTKGKDIQLGNLMDYEGNINDHNTLEKYVQKINPDIVFHLAAQALVRDSYRNPIETWKTNVIGTLNLLESLKKCPKYCAAILISSDKVYKNNEWLYGYRENDVLGGNDPYSASKAAMEIAIESWDKSFCGESSYQTNSLVLATARAGNVIGGGDWSKDRLLPDVIKAFQLNQTVNIRNPNSKRPWQHVLEPLHGYMLLAEKIYQRNADLGFKKRNLQSFNFGPGTQSNRTVEELVNIIIETWKGSYKIDIQPHSFHEAKLLHLVSDKAKEILNWEQKINFEDTVRRTVYWYKNYFDGTPAINCCLEDILFYESILNNNDNNLNKERVQN